MTAKMVDCSPHRCPVFVGVVFVGRSLSESFNYVSMT